MIDSTNKCIKKCSEDTIFESIYEYNDGCYKSCPNGYYTKEDGTNVCKCMTDISCKDCPSIGNANNLCSTCNDEKQFYPISEEKDKNLKRCYNITTKPKNYILKTGATEFEACYPSCETCNEIGDDTNHKCTTCKNGYTNSPDSNKCQLFCADYFYYDNDNQIQCTTQCQEDYSKLIDSSTRCINKCGDLNLYEYNNIWYNNICYEGDKCKNGKYKKDDIDTCKCMSNIACLECPFTEDENTLCYSCNNEQNYYPRKDEEINDGGLRTCYNRTTIPKNYFLNSTTKEYQPCYESCGTCETIGTDLDHKCETCKDETYEKFNQDNNCYKKCQYYYYFDVDDDGKYKCTEQDICPNGYKLIKSKNKCIKKCEDDHLFNSKYEYNGECYEKCPNGYYKKDGIDTCKCMSNIACLECPFTGDENTLCYSCNNDKNYYPRKDEEIYDGLRTCYNRTTIPKNYILNSTTKEYQPCYESCEECVVIGTENDHKCKVCKYGYTKLNNDDNCYQICTHYYYFDEHGKYHCLNENKCPTDYKLIFSTNKCIKNCADIGKYEYNNICQEACPNYWSDTEYDHICKLDCAQFHLYFNYEKTDCIETIPKGYYLKDRENKIIDKCHDNCEECEIGPTENNNNCLKCKTTGTIYYDFGNCRESCVNGNYIDENSIKKCKCSSNIACQACDENGKCLSCNNDIGYYQIEENTDENNENIKCEKDPEGYYLSENKYKKCNDKCKSCNGEGDDKCIECNIQYEFKNDLENDKKCHQKCTYNYYYDANNDVKCTEDDSCPDGMKFIEPKKRCIEFCKNDNIYKFEFNGTCFIQCPENTKVSSDDSNKCEEIKEETTILTTEIITTTEIIATTQIIEEKTEECSLKYNEFELFNDSLTNEEINSLTKNYVSKHGDSNNYITKIENEYYKIFIYNNIFCLKSVAQDAKWVDFDFSGDYLSILEKLKINDPIITIITNKTSNLSAYSFADPDTGDMLNNLNTEVRNLEILELEDINSALSHIDGKRREYIIQMIKQEIDLFDPENKFYTDLCFHYDSPNKKDIAMKDRASFFYVNINKCETRCISKGIDFSNAKFKCECNLRIISDTGAEGDISTTQSNVGFPKKKSSVNIKVFKCIKYAFDKKYFKNNAGGIIMLILSIGQIACMTLYFVLGISKLRKHTFSLLEAYKKITNDNDINDANPPKKQISNKKSNLDNDIILMNTINTKKNEKQNDIKNSDNKLTLNIKEINETEVRNINKNTERLEKMDENESVDTNKDFGNDTIYTKLINEYINPEFDEKDFDEVLAKDKRTFLQFFTEKIFKNQIFIKTFLIKHIYKPLTLKIMYLIFTLEIYFVITAAFYSENYISDLFFSDEKDGFLSFISRRFYEITLSALICGVIGYFCTYFFDHDEYLKRLFTKKTNVKINLALNQFVKDLKIKFIILIAISIAFTIFSFLYIACFNVVYRYLKHEWIKSSIVLFLLMQIINLVSTLLGTCCRYLSIKWNNIKLFRLSLNLD